MDISKLKNIKQAPVLKREYVKKSNSDSLKAVAIFDNNKFYAKLNKDNTLHEIFIDINYLNKVSYSYSNGITNDRYEPWTIHKRRGFIKSIELANKFWTIIKPDIKINGKLENGFYILDLDYLNIIGESIYNRYIKSNKKVLSRYKHNI